jgi:anti-sigma B factor antagonist
MFTMAATLTLSEENRNQVHVLRAHGKLTLGEGASALRDAVHTLVAAGTRQIILDLTEVSYMDSAGIGELVSAYTSVTSHGGKLVLTGLPQRISDLLKITKLYTVFQVFENVDQAAAALTAAAEG